MLKEAAIGLRSKRFDKNLCLTKIFNNNKIIQNVFFLFPLFLNLSLKYKPTLEISTNSI